MDMIVLHGRNRVVIVDDHNGAYVTVPASVVAPVAFVVDTVSSPHQVVGVVEILGREIARAASYIVTEGP